MGISYHTKSMQPFPYTEYNKIKDTGCKYLSQTGWKNLTKLILSALLIIKTAIISEIQDVNT